MMSKVIQVNWNQCKHGKSELKGFHVQESYILLGASKVRCQSPETLLAKYQTSNVQLEYNFMIERTWLLSVKLKDLLKSREIKVWISGEQRYFKKQTLNELNTWLLV